MRVVDNADNFTLVARVKAPRGEDGLVSAVSFSDFPERFERLEEAYVDFYGDKKRFVVEFAQTRGDAVFLKFERFDSYEDVEVLVGRDVFVKDEDAVELPEDVYFVHDLIGAEVFRNGEKLGEIENVFSTPANDVYEIRTEDGEELAIPAVSAFVESFDPKTKRMTLTPGGDLYDDEN